MPAPRPVPSPPTLPAAVVEPAAALGDPLPVAARRADSASVFSAPAAVPLAEVSVVKPASPWPISRLGGHVFVVDAQQRADGLRALATRPAAHRHHVVGQHLRAVLFAALLQKLQRVLESDCSAPAMRSRTCSAFCSIWSSRSFAAAIIRRS